MTTTLTIKEETLNSGQSTKGVEKIETVTPETIQVPDYDYGNGQNSIDGAIGVRNIQTNISDDAYSASWDGDTTHPPSKNAVYDKLNSMDTTISGKASISDLFLLMGA